MTSKPGIPLASLALAANSFASAQTLLNGAHDVVHEFCRDYNASPVYPSVGITAENPVAVATRKKSALTTVASSTSFTPSGNP